MKKFSRSILIALSLIISPASYAMKRPYSNITPSEQPRARTLSEQVQAYAASTPSSLSAPASQPLIEAYFVPQDFIREKLFSLLDQAQSEILVAMYLITDDSLFDKLIELKRRKNIDIRIIMDESSTPKINLIRKLNQRKIALLIHPSSEIKNNIGANVLMHNKFIVIDKHIVWTGSANYTQPAFNLLVNRVNFENVMIVRDPFIGQKYTSSFSFIEDNIIEIYISILAETGNIPNLISRMIPIIIEPRFRNVIASQLQEYSPAQQNKVRHLLGLHDSTKAGSHPSKYQRDTLSAYLTDDQIDSMTYKEAYDFIGQLLKKGKL